MRGKALKMGAQAREVGITPAYAGKRLSSSFDTFHPQYHPRICGEKKGNSEMIAINLGSPPHMRGKGEQGPQGPIGPGITPAYAGKREGGIAGNVCEQDHPRICGEKGCWQIKRARCEGSPPHMRGKAVFLRFSGLVPGITPAYAGKRSQGKCGLHHRWDHPRICGEKCSTSLQGRNTKGSPPHMRGKAAGCAEGADERRITPAYAGKSHGQQCPQTWGRDHPRICGEKFY